MERSTHLTAEEGDVVGAGPALAVQRRLALVVAEGGVDVAVEQFSGRHRPRRTGDGLAGRRRRRLRVQQRRRQDAEEQVLVRRRRPQVVRLRRHRLAGGQRRRRRRHSSRRRRHRFRRRRRRFGSFGVRWSCKGSTRLS